MNHVTWDASNFSVPDKYRCISRAFPSICLLFFAVAIGGWAATDNSSAGKPFSIQERDGITWLVRPNGERFFSFGICCVSQGASRKEFDTNNPSYAAWQHYTDSNHWAEATLKRLKSWRFTTVGGWSDFAAFKQCRDTNVGFAPVLHIGSTAGAPWWDMWDAKITDRMDEVAREQILSLRDDPRVIGYYSDNEMGWWNGILLKMTLEQAATIHRAELVSNIISHAQARRVDIDFNLDKDRLDLSVLDDGIGRNPRAWSHGLGLGGVRKRVKQLGGEVEWREVSPHGIVCRVVIRDFSARHSGS